MSATVRTVAHIREFIFLCPYCKGELERTSHTCDTEPVWKCVSCHCTYIYLSRGWCACRVQV
jgi:hypothetical protein